MIGDNTVPITTNKDSIPSNKANLVALLSGFETNAPQAYIPENKNHKQATYISGFARE